jgi:hypothetical protein
VALQRRVASDPTTASPDADTAGLSMPGAAQADRSIGHARGFRPALLEAGSFRLEPEMAGEGSLQHRDGEALAADAVVTPPDLGKGSAESGESFADVVVGFDEDERLDVTLLAGDREAAQALEARSAELEAALGALGTEVEAIRVELRGASGPDASTEPGGSAAFLQQQGQWGEQRQTEQRQTRADIGQRFGGRMAGAGGADGGAVLDAASPSDGKVDRYA